jgi:hypothetical protein
MESSERVFSNNTAMPIKREISYAVIQHHPNKLPLFNILSLVYRTKLICEISGLNMLYVHCYKAFKQFICILILSSITISSFLGAIANCHAKSVFDPDDDDPIFEIQKDDTTPLFDDGESQKNLFLDSFLNDSKFTLGYKTSHGTEHETKIIDNSFYLHFEYKTLSDQNIFFKFDGKTSIHPESDHIADAKGQDLFIDGSVREAFFQTGYGNYSFKIGQQLSVWGKSDIAAITDVVSPRDNSQFIFTRLEDARIGQIMFSGNIFLNDANAYIFISPFPKTDIKPDSNSRYDKLSAVLDPFLVKPDKPGFGDFEYGLKIDKRFSKTDVSIMAGHFYSNMALLNYGGYKENLKAVMQEIYPEYQLAGTALEHAWQSCLFKMELAFKNQFPLQGINPESLYIFEKKDVFDSAFGIEYNANDKYQMHFEISNRYIFSNTSGLLPGTDKNSSIFYYTFTKKFLNQALDFEYIFSYDIRYQSRFHYFRITYDLTDDIEILTEYAFLNAHDENSLMWLYRHEDRIGLELKYYF